MESQFVVAREGQLARLDAFLERTIGSRGMVCFVTGEAGSGKTTLVTQFARLAQEKHKDLAVAVGQSDAHTGMGDAHLPFREILGQLTGDVDSKLAQGVITRENAGRLRKMLVLSGQALVDLGPDLIGAFVPGVGLATRVGTFVAEKAGWLEKLEQLAGKPRQAESPAPQDIDQGNIYEQYANVLCRLAETQPLLVVLDDLQWADEASIGLLFRLARRITEHRILVIGTYRPEDVAIGRNGDRHPLEKVIAEIKRYFGDIQVDLDQAEEDERRNFVHAILDTEPNRLDQEFRRRLFVHTGGQPLFTIEVLRALQERGDLVRDEHGRWVQSPGLAWGTLPGRVEGVIEERIGRLEEDLHEILSVCSVEGENFTAEVVSRVLAEDARTQVKKLSAELDKRHRLVTDRGGRRLPQSGQRISLFRFQHNLIRTYLYNELGETERVYMHEDIGSVLEELYAGQLDEILVQLAAHFDRAGVVDKAVHYLHLAGDQAAERFANAEAERYYQRALALLPDSGTDRHDLRYQLHLALENIHARTANREAQQRELDVLCDLSEQLGDEARRAEVSIRQARCSEALGEYPTAMDQLHEALEAAQAAGDQAREARAYHGMGYLLWRKGEYKNAREQSLKALELAQRISLRDIEAKAMHNLAVTFWRLGELKEATAIGHRCLDLSREIRARGTEGSALGILGNIALGTGDLDTAREHYEAFLKNEIEMGDRRGQAMALGNLGIVAEIQGDFARAMGHFQQVRRLFQDMGDRNSEARALGHMGVNANLHGGFEAARTAYEAAIEMYREIGDQQGQAWVLPMLSRLLLHFNELDLAETHARAALSLSREIAVPGMEAAAWSALACMHMERGDTGDAHAAFTKSLALFQKTGNEDEVVAVTSNLARLSLALGDADAAHQGAGLVRQHLRKAPFQGMVDGDPFDVYLNCFIVLDTLEDPEAGEVLREAFRLLMTQASRISDPEQRLAYLEKIPSHLAIRRAVETAQ